MKRIFTMALCAVAAAGLLAGCEWSSSSDENESWNDSYNWVNFSGTYRSASGGILVTDYTTMSSGGTNNYNTTESGGTLNDGQTSASGTTQHSPITPGSFSVVVGEVTLSDNGSGTLSGGGGSGSVSYAGGTWSIKLDSGSSSSTASASESGGTLGAGSLAASGTAKHGSIVEGSFTVKIGSDLTLSDDGSGNLNGGKSGSVNYSGGAWSFELADTQWSSSARNITVTYSYKVSDTSGKRTITVRYSYGASNNGSSSGAKAGSSGNAIYSFVVAQQGQKLKITDNNGSVYSGRITALRSSSGVSPTNSLPRDGDTIIASFTTKGTSAAGKDVTITGTFQGTVAASVFTGRTMQGTWIEAGSGGKTGDINGTTSNVSISSSVPAGETTATGTDTTTTTETTTE